MKFEIVKNELAGALAALGKLVTRTSPVGANKSIRIKGENGKLVFHSTNTHKAKKEKNGNRIQAKNSH